MRHVDPVEQHRELFAIVKSWELDPFTGDIFAFIGKRADRVKLLAWHRNPSWPQRMSIGCDARYTRVRGGSASIAYRLSNARTSRARSHST